MSERNGAPGLRSWPSVKRAGRRAALRLIQAAALYLAALHAYALVLWFAPAPTTILMAQRAVEGETLWRNRVALEEVSPHLIRAVIAAEDTRFCDHWGVDFEAVGTAVEEWRAGKGLRGASTISQQTAKNLFFWNGGGLPRKAGDAWMALATDTVWGKRRVLEHYLNVAEWGDGIFGVEAAARLRFKTRARDLTPRQAALLAAVLPSPNRWRVDPPGPYVRQRAATIEARMRVVRNEGLDACVLVP
ncbi:MAG: monofunctional biosynthetic peptidoglycan transglycosylase [Pseudomonadota bacterium]